MYLDPSEISFKFYGTGLVFSGYKYAQMLDCAFRLSF